MYVELSAIKEDLKQLKKELQCSHFRIIGGMAKRGKSKKDVDVIFQSGKGINKLKPILRKWNEIFKAKYGIFLHAYVERERSETIYDFIGSNNIIRRKPSLPPPKEITEKPLE